jgi:hypothetical protein
MSTTDNLLLPLVEVNQEQKEVTVNEAITLLDGAICGSQSIEVVDGDNAFTATQVREGQHLVLIPSQSSPPTTTVNVVLPAVRRFLVFTNACGYSAVIRCGGGGSPPNQSVTIPNDTTAVLFCDSVEVYGVAASASSTSQEFIDLADVPASYTGAATRFVRVNAGEDALEFAVANLTDLADVDGSYSGAAEYILRVKADGSGVEFVPASSIPLGINAQTGTTYDLALSDAGGVVTLDNGSPITVTVPANSSVAFPVGTVIVLAQIGAGQVTVAEASAGSPSVVTIYSPETLKLRKQFAQASLTKIGTDTWLLEGNLEAAA